MKVHIPVQLRSALLACLAVLPMPMATSIMTGTLTVGAVSYVLSQQQAQAEVIVYTGGNSEAFRNSTAEDSVIFDATSHWIDNNNPTINGVIYIRQVGLWDGATEGGNLGIDGTRTGITGISSGRSMTFDNAIRDFSHYLNSLPDGETYTPPAGAAPNTAADGEEDFVDKSTGDIFYNVNTAGVNVLPMSLYFAGAMKDFSGDIISIGSGLVIEFEDYSLGLSTQEDRNASASGTGEIKIGGRRVKYDMTGNVTVNNTKITVSNTINGNAVIDGNGNALDPTLEFTWSGNYNVSSEILADNLIVNINATASFSKNVTSTTSQQFMGTTNFTGGTSSFTGTTTVTGSLTIADGAAVSLLGTTALGNTTNNGQLTLGGTVAFTQTMAGTGTIIVNADTIFDITGLASTSNGNELSYQLFAEGMAVNPSSLTAANITGVATGGRAWALNADGTLTGVLTANLHTITGDVLDLGVGTDINGSLFEDGDLLTFTTAPSTITLTEDISSGYVDIDGVAVTLTGAGNTLESTIELKGAASLILKDGALAATSTVTGADGSSVVYDLGAGNTLDNELQLLGYTGDVIVESGTLVYATPGTSRTETYSLTVKEGASLTVGVSLDTIGITLEGASDASIETLLTMQDATYAGLLTTSGHTTLRGNAIVYLDGGVTTSGVLTKQGTNEVHIRGGNVDLNGEIHITEGQLSIGDANNENFDLTGLTAVSVSTGATLRWQHGGEQMTGATLTLDGGKLLSYDMNSAFGEADAENLAVSARWGKLVVGDAGGTIEFQFKGKQVFNEMTGTGDLTINFPNTQYVTELRAVYIENLVDYDGTITNGAAAGLAKRLYINNVNQGAGMEAQVTGDPVYATDFTMSGAGSLTLGTTMTADSVTLKQEGDFSITQTLTTDSFAQTGTGTSNLTGLSIADGGSLTMNYNGTLDITTLTLGANIVLGYSAGANVLAITEAQAATVESFILNVVDVDRTLLELAAGGYDLGLAGTIDQALFSILGLDAGYSLDNSSGTWKLTLDADAEFDFDGWDINWGAEEIARAPLALVAEDGLVGTAGTMNNFYLNGQTSTDGEAYTVDGTTTVTLTGGGRATVTVNADAVSVYGGSTAGASTTNSWIQVEGGEFFTIGGGGLSQSFTGNSHIILNQTEGNVNYIVGGNNQDSGSPTFTGDSYISIYSNTLLGSVIGGSTNMHNATTTFNGDTNIFIYAVMNATATPDIHNHGSGNLGEDQIIGSNAWGANSAGTGVHNGASNVTIDLSNVTLAEAASFAKRIIGGSYAGRGWAMSHTGDTNVTVTGTADLTFSKEILGGSYSTSTGALTHSGSTHLTINGNGATFDSAANVGIIGANYSSGGATSILTGSTNVVIHGTGSTFNDRVVAGSEHVAGTGTITEGTNLTIHGGTYTSHVMGGVNQHSGTFNVGGTSLTITDGTFTGKVFGGSVHAAGTNTNTAGTIVNISGGSFTNNVHGGSIDINNAGISSTAGPVVMNLTGGTFSTYITGGSNIGAAYAGTTTVDGGVTINVDGATMNGNIIGGHIRTTGTTAATVSMGDVAINLMSGSIGADVHAAGHLTTAFTGATTASTTVTVGSSIEFTGTNQVINGGFGGAAATSGVVTGDRTLAFSDATYGNLDNVSYSNFDVVEVTAADGQVSIAGVEGSDSITKTGAGTLTLTAAQNGKNLTASEGILALQAASSLTNLTMAGGTLSLATDPSISVTDELSITGGALSMNKGYTGIALDTDASLTLNTGSTLDLSIIGAVADEDIEQVIFSGVDANATNLTGITLEVLDNGELGVSANALFGSIDNGDTASYTAADMFLVLRDGNLVLVSTVSRNLHWAGGDAGTWGMDNDVWQKEGVGDLIDFERNDNVFFTAAQDTTITMNAAVEVYKMSVSGADTTYTFTGDATNSITVAGSLSLESGADVIFNASVDLTTADVNVGLDSVLTSTQTTDLTIKSLINEGDVSLSAANTTITETVATGGNFSTTGNLTLADGDNIFGALVAQTVTADSLSIAGGSDIITFDGSSLTITAGAVTIDNLGTLDSFSNAGTVTTTGDVTFTADVATGGVLHAGNVTLQGTTNSFTTLTAGAVTQAAEATLTVLSGDSELESISGGSVAVTAGSLSITDIAETSLASISGGGSLSTAGDLTLTSATAQTINALSVGGSLTTAGVLSVTTNLTAHHMNLSGALSVGAGNSINTTGSALSTISINYMPLSAGPAITGGSFNSQALRFDMSNDVLLSMGLNNGDSYVLADMEMANTITGLFLNSDTENLYVDGIYNYTITHDSASNNFIISLLVRGNDWQGTVDSAWSTEGNWLDGVPSTDRDAVLADAVNTKITLGDDAIARNVRVEMTSSTGNYELSNGDLTAETLSIVVGQLTLKGDAEVTVTDVNGDASGGLIVLDQDGTLALEAGAILNADKMTINEDGTLTNAGSLNVDELSAADRTIANTGTLTLGDGSTIDTLTGAGGTLALVEDATVSIGTMSDQALNLAAGSELKVAANTTLSTMSGTGSLTIGTGADGKGLTVAAGSSGITSGTLYADTLTLEEGSSARFTQLSVNTIVINGDLAIDEARLGATQLGDFANTGTAPTLDITSIGEMKTGEAGITKIYYVYEQAGANWSSITLSDATKVAINAHIVEGNDVLQTTTGDSLTFTMQESTDRLWKVSENFAVTAQQGADLSVLKPIFDEEGKMMDMNILDTVDRVYVDADFKIDLRGVANSTGNPLLVQNLTGDAGTTLSIVGDGIDQDTVALRNTAASFAENALDVKDATITSQSFSDGSSSVLELGSLNLNNAALEVISPAGSGAVTGAPTGLTVGQLTNVDAEGDEVITSVVEGLLSINGAGGIYTGAYKSKPEDEGATLNMMQGANQALKAGDGLTVSGSGGHAHIIGGADGVMDQIKTTGADVTIDFSMATAADQALTIDKASSMEGGTLTLVLNKTLFEAGEVQETLNFADGGSLTLSASSALHITVDNPTGLLTMPTGSGTSDVVIAGLTAGLSVGTDDITLGGGLEKLFTNVRYEDGKIVADVNSDVYSQRSQSANGAAGYKLLDKIFIELNPQDNTDQYEDLAAVMNSLDALYDASNFAAADKLAAAIAGASTASIGMAVSGDMSRQLGSIRNRTINMGSDPEMDMEGELNFKGWISAEGGSSELSGEGTLAGYDLSSWGGTVGAELDLNSQHTIGLALSALYGSFTSSDVDSQNGDINTNYLSFFARSYSGRWSHSFVASAGMSDISSTRTVTHTLGSYDANGSTNGMSYGALYEVAYTCAMSESGRTAWQPLASISFQSSTVDGYTETGSDAALEVGEQTVSYATLAVGARVETVIGESIYNRASTLSLRAMAKADLGDTSSSADVRIMSTQDTVSVESQERGQFALELGAGLQIPVMGDTSLIFIDTSVELRENQTNVNGSVGYRFSF